MKLWVDDVRVPPDETWVWAKNVQQAFDAFTEDEWEPGRPWSEISLDHDMGPDGVGGYEDIRPFVRFLARYDLWPPVVRVHSQNVVGRVWLEEMVNRYGPGVTK